MLSRSSAAGGRLDTSAAAAAIRDAAETLPPPGDAEAFGALFDRFGEARIVLLGEATHGTSEFYQARAAITRRLIERHGFTIVAVEADWPDAQHVDRYVRHRAPAGEAEAAFSRFPAWMWRNGEVQGFTEWLRAHNAALPPERRAEFRGLDVYGLRGGIAAVLGFLDHADPELAAAARRRYGCLTPWQADPADYGRAVLFGAKDPCEDAVAAQLRDMLERRLQLVDGDEEGFFEALGSARTVLAAEQYYRAMYHGSTESWNGRDQHMFDTLQALLGHRSQRAGAEAKAVVWAHNSHIGDARATEMGWAGQLNIGQLCRQAHGPAAALLGFGTDRGRVAAASAWDGPMEVRNIRPSHPGSYERAFRDAGRSRALLDWRGPDRTGLREALAGPGLEHAIGVIYRPEAERQSHYFDAELPEQFDAFIWFEETQPVTPLPTAQPQGVPETYPFGL